MHASDKILFSGLSSYMCTVSVMPQWGVLPSSEIIFNSGPALIFSMSRFGQQGEMGNHARQNNSFWHNDFLPTAVMELQIIS